MSGPVDLSRSPYAVLRPVAGRIAGGFWGERQALNRDVLLPAAAERLEEAGNFDNLRIAAGRRRGAYRGALYLDSDLHKWLEALGWELGREPSPNLERLADETIGLLADAQDETGYLNSYYQVVRPAPRFSRLATDHELYCAGHLLQAAVAHARARGERRLAAVATRLADHVESVFGAGGRAGACGHPGIEMALVEIWRLTGERRYLVLAQRFLDARGHGLLGGSSYYLDHVPVREARSVAGHAVRALYLAGGATDLALETGERALMDAMRAWWADMAASRAYITGGLGAHHADEGFGAPYELPPDRCYGETCAAVASIMWSWRMLLATGEPAFADLLERTLYNGFLAGVALDGSGYAYLNPLHVREAHSGFAGRLPWYECACCPPNAMRLLASLHHYLATADAHGLQLHLYASGEVRAGRVRVRVETGYPWEGGVEVEVVQSIDAPWTLSLRVPGWCDGAGVEVEGRPDAALGPGYVRLRRRWRPGDRVRLELPMPPRLTEPHPRIDAVRGCLAIERGPLVYCLEQPDHPGTAIDDLRLASSAPLQEARDPDLLGGIVTVRAAGAYAPADGWSGGWPYRRLSGGGTSPGDGEPTAAAGPPAPGSAAPVAVTAVPYFAWGNRGVGGMRVWIPCGG